MVDVNINIIRLNVNELNISIKRLSVKEKVNPVSIWKIMVYSHYWIQDFQLYTYINSNINNWVNLVAVIYHPVFVLL